MTLLQIAADHAIGLSIQTILISIIGSGAFAGLISFFSNQRMKTIDYRFEYRKYILQKRQNAYIDIEKILVRLGSKKKKFNSNRPLHTIFTITTGNDDPVYNFLESITNILNQHSFWITKEIHDKIIDLLNFLSAYHEVKDPNNIILLSQLEELGMNNFEKIETFRIEISSQFFKDIKELDDIEKFKKSKRHF